MDLRWRYSADVRAAIALGFITRCNSMLPGPQGTKLGHGGEIYDYASCLTGFLGVTGIGGS